MMSSGMILKQIELGPMMNFIYLIGCAATGEAAIIDPAWDVPAILKAAQNANLVIKQILVTHAHPDHINALEPLLRATNAQIIMHSDELAYLQAIAHGFNLSTDFLKEYPNNIRSVSDGEVFKLGDLSIQCVLTPGHTPGSLCFLAEGCLFSGDTLFVDACGRVDIPGGDARQMWKSLNQTLRALPDDIILYPGHDYGGSPKATLGEQKQNNPYMNYPSVEDFVRDMS